MATDSLMPSGCAASKLSNGSRKKVTTAGRFISCPAFEEGVAESARHKLQKPQRQNRGSGSNTA
jgi:hypothetical protein